MSPEQPSPGNLSNQYSSALSTPIPLTVIKSGFESPDHRLLKVLDRGKHSVLKFMFYTITERQVGLGKNHKSVNNGSFDGLPSHVDLCPTQTSVFSSLKWVGREG